MIHETFSDWLHHISEGAFASDVAKKIDVPSATVSGWLRKNNPSFQGVMKIAVAYNLNPLLAFIETGLVPRSCLPEIENIKSLQTLSKRDLLEEVVRRELREEILEEEKHKHENFIKEVHHLIKEIQEFKKLFTKNKDAKKFYFDNHPDRDILKQFLQEN